VGQSHATGVCKSNSSFGKEEEVIRKTLSAAYLGLMRLKMDIPFSLYEEAAVAPSSPEAPTSCVREERVGNSEVICVAYWPHGKRAAFNLNFDDLCPLYEDGVDFGGCPDAGINIWFSEFLRRFPDVRVTHFVIPEADPRFSGRAKLTQSLAIGHSHNRKWLAWLHELHNSGRVEIAAHGFTHYNGRMRIRRHAEFAFLREEETRQAIARCREAFHAAGLEPTGFRQPGWDLAADLHLIDVLADYGFHYIAGSAPGSGLNYGSPRVPDNAPATIRSLVNIPQNTELGLSLDSLLERVDQLVTSESLISLKGHYTNMEDIPNALSSFSMHNAEKVMEYLAERYDNAIWFATLNEVAERYVAIQLLSISQTAEGRVELANHSSRSLQALSIYWKGLQNRRHAVDLAPGERKVVLL
jgi:hypothetical protein